MGQDQTLPEGWQMCRTYCRLSSSRLHLRPTTRTKKPPNLVDRAAAIPALPSIYDYVVIVLKSRPVGNSLRGIGGGFGRKTRRMAEKRRVSGHSRKIDLWWLLYSSAEMKAIFDAKFVLIGYFVTRGYSKTSCPE